MRFLVKSAVSPLKSVFRQISRLQKRIMKIPLDDFSALKIETSYKQHKNRSIDGVTFEKLDIVEYGQKKRKKCLTRVSSTRSASSGQHDSCHGVIRRRWLLAVLKITVNHQKRFAGGGLKSCGNATVTVGKGQKQYLQVIGAQALRTTDLVYQPCREHSSSTREHTAKQLNKRNRSPSLL